MPPTLIDYNLIVVVIPTYPTVLFTILILVVTRAIRTCDPLPHLFWYDFSWYYRYTFGVRHIFVIDDAFPILLSHAIVIVVVVGAVDYNCWLILIVYDDIFADIDCIMVQAKIQVKPQFLLFCS